MSKNVTIQQNMISNKPSMNGNKAKHTYLTDALGMDPYNNELIPLYNPNTPCPFTVVETQCITPLYFGTAASESNCN